MNYVALDGKALSRWIERDLARRTEHLTAKVGRPPGLGVILVGDNPASHTYVASKEKRAKKCGFATFDIRLPASATQGDVAAAIDSFNANPGVDGILLQLPLPKGLDQTPLIARIDESKDADGLHPSNQGELMRGASGLRPCTPLGVMALIDAAFSLRRSGGASIDDALAGGDLPRADLAGLHAVVIGRSVLVGKPVALMLLERNATVTMAHSKTPDLAAVVGRADIVVAAVGVPEMVRGTWLKPGAMVLDVGINKTSDGSLVGDVNFAEAAERASYLTPVPGGVGPMTIAMLLSNTLTAYVHRNAERCR